MARKPTKKQVMSAIYDSGGIIDEIARRLGVAWATARAYIDKWEETKQAYEIENERIIDLAEETVLKSIKAGDTSDAKWLLTRKGRKRGYGEALEVNNSGKQRIEIVYEDSTPETTHGAEADQE